MEEWPSSTYQEEDDDNSDSDGDGDDVPQVQVTIVNETNLEAAKVSYDKIHSIHVYSLSPSPIHVLFSDEEFKERQTTRRAEGYQAEVISRVGTKSKGTSSYK